MPAEVVGTGPECATLPNFGDGAFSELADDPAGTAISNTQETSTLQQFLGDAELLETLDGEGPFTVFAPRNRAFVDLGDQLGLLAADPDALAATLSYHVIEGEALTSEDLAAEGSRRHPAGRRSHRRGGSRRGDVQRRPGHGRLR